MEPIFWFVDNFTHLLGPVICTLDIAYCMSCAKRLPFFPLVFCICCNMFNNCGSYDMLLDRIALLVEQKSVYDRVLNDSRTLVVIKRGVQLL